MHEQTEICLDRERQMNRDMIVCLNQAELPVLVKIQRLRLSDVSGLGSVIKANYVMKEALKQQDAPLIRATSDIRDKERAVTTARTTHQRLLHLPEKRKHVLALQDRTRHLASNLDA